MSSETDQLRAKRPTVGIVASTLELYEQLAPQLRIDREQWLHGTIVPMLETVADVRVAPTVRQASQARQAVADFEHDGVDALLVVCLTYSPSQVLLPALQQTRLPIMIWNTQQLYGVGPEFDEAAMVANHGVHGTQDLCNVLLRASVRFEYVTSHADDSDCLHDISDFLIVASSVARLGQLKLGLMGYPFPGMGDFSVDLTHLVSSLGCQWEPLSVQDYNERASHCSVQDVGRLITEYRKTYDLAPDLTSDDLEGTARAELAFRALVREHGLDAFSYQFQSFGEDERTETLPFVAASRLMAEGIGFAGEGDLVGAVGTWLLGQLQTPASFSEIFTVDFEGNGLFMSHMGEANVAMARADRPTLLMARPRPITRTRRRQLALIPSFQPGPATLCALTLGPNQRWRMIVGRVKILDFGPLNSLCVPYFKVQPESMDVRDWLTAYAKLGGPHHHAICFGDATSRIKTAADLVNAEYCEIGG